MTRIETTPKIPAPDAVQDLDGDQKKHIVGQRVQHATDRQRCEADQQQRLAPQRSGRRPVQRSEERDDQLRRYHTGRHEHHRGPALSFGKHLSEQRQHRGVGKVEEDR